MVRDFTMSCIFLFGRRNAKKCSSRYFFYELTIGNPAGMQPYNIGKETQLIGCQFKKLSVFIVN